MEVVDPQYPWCVCKKLTGPRHVPIMDFNTLKPYMLSHYVGADEQPVIVSPEDTFDDLPPLIRYHH